VDTQIRDQLARQRTELANERTLLAYIRTGLGFVIVGVPAVWWIDHPYIQVLGGLSLVVGAGCVAFGIRRFMTVRSLVAQGFGTQEEGR
jgi:putative membrane protein